MATSLPFSSTRPGKSAWWIRSSLGYDAAAWRPAINHIPCRCSVLNRRPLRLPWTAGGERRADRLFQRLGAADADSGYAEIMRRRLAVLFFLQLGAVERN